MSKRASLVCGKGGLSRTSDGPDRSLASLTRAQPDMACLRLLAMAVFGPCDSFGRFATTHSRADFDFSAQPLRGAWQRVLPSKQYTRMFFFLGGLGRAIHMLSHRIASPPQSNTEAPRRSLRMGSVLETCTRWLLGRRSSAN